jgi:phenylacetate-CoA ligase
MELCTADERRRFEGLERRALAEHQCVRLNRLLDEILPANRFYADKLARIRRPIASLAELADWPLTCKEELIAADRGDELAANLTYPLVRYARLHQTSGTRGRPLVVLDTAEDWEWWLEGWQYVLDVAEICASDRVLMAFSFGPFIGFWSAYDAIARRGALVIPSGGMSSAARLRLLRMAGATVICCTPSYALHLIEVAEQHQTETASLGVRAIIVAGEPGGSTPSVRARIEAGWQSAVVDHAGATEVGPWGYGDDAGLGLFVNESQFIAEFLSVDTGRAAAEGELSELVLTTLGRAGSPVIRYRTGDLVRPTWRNESTMLDEPAVATRKAARLAKLARASSDRPAVALGEGQNRFVFLEGGVLGRADDMLVVRGVNIFPSSIDQIMRSFPEVVEYRATVDRAAAMDQISIEIEDRLDRPGRVADELQLRLGLKVNVVNVPLGSLPRFEGKGKRFVDRR